MLKGNYPRVCVWICFVNVFPPRQFIWETEWVREREQEWQGQWPNAKAVICVRMENRAGRLGHLLRINQSVLRFRHTTNMCFRCIHERGCPMSYIYSFGVVPFDLGRNPIHLVWKSNLSCFVVRSKVYKNVCGRCCVLLCLTLYEVGKDSCCCEMWINQYRKSVCFPIRIDLWKWKHIQLFNKFAIIYYLLFLNKHFNKIISYDKFDGLYNSINKVGLTIVLIVRKRFKYNVIFNYLEALPT